MDPDTFTTSNSFTRSVYRDIYPAVDPRNKELSKKGQVVLITGASRGIGRHGLSEAFALAGAKAIIITARKVDALVETEAAIKKTNPLVEVLKVALEVTSETSVQAAFKTISKHYQTIDILVNNAGLFGSHDQHLATADPTTWWSDFQVNVFGTFLVTKYFLTFIGSEKKDAHIVYLSSGAGLGVFPGNSAYSITKLADLQIAAYAAMENPHVKVIAYHPGIVMTDMATEGFKPFAKDSPQLAGAVVNWLTSEQADFLNGRYTTANWDVTELIARKDEIVEKNLLTIKLSGLDGLTAVNLTKVAA